MQKNRKIIFRADGNSQIGLGHVSRCAAIAQALKESFTVCFAIQEPSEQLYITLKEACTGVLILARTQDYEADAKQFCKYVSAGDIVVLDGYSFNSAYQLACKKKGAILICIDDLHEMCFYADVIFNHCGSASRDQYRAQPYTQYFLGTHYAILRQPFLQAASKVRKIPAVDTIFIHMGGADINNLSLNLLEQCYGIHELKTIILLVGSANPHLHRLRSSINNQTNKKTILMHNADASDVCSHMLSAQIAVCPPSVTAYEACSTGLGLILYQTADNQKDIYDFLIQSEMALGLTALECFPQALTTLINHPETIEKQIGIQRQYFDGKSMERIVNVFYNLLND